MSSSVELHLPDLPEVPLAVGGPPPPADPNPAPARRAGRAWREALATWLPLLCMLLMALGTWWLGKRAPQAEEPSVAAARRTEPDYTMQGFAVERFDASGRRKLRIAGVTLRHYPDDGRLEIDDVRITAQDRQGRPSQATARRAVANAAGTQVQLLGQAELTGADAAGVPLRLRSEELLLLLEQDRVTSERPVTLEYGRNQARAAGIDLDHARGLLRLQGPMQARLLPAKP